MNNKEVLLGTVSSIIRRFVRDDTSSTHACVADQTYRSDDTELILRAADNVLLTMIDKVVICDGDGSEELSKERCTSREQKKEHKDDASSTYNNSNNQNGNIVDSRDISNTEADQNDDDCEERDDQANTKQNAEEMKEVEAVLFNSDTLSKVISFLPSVDVLNLALTCKRFGVSNNDDNSLIKESTLSALLQIATNDQLVALPLSIYDGESSLSDYHYLQLIKGPLAFDRLVGAEYVNRGDKSCVRHSGNSSLGWGTAFSDNIMRAGKHYATFNVHGTETLAGMELGVMRPGQPKQQARGLPYYKQFYQNFSQHTGEDNHDNKVHCCMYAHDGKCCTSDWSGFANDVIADRNWEGSEKIYGEIGLLLNLDEGTLTVYKNGRKLGVMKRGLVGPYCWVASMGRGKGVTITIKSGTIPPS